MKINHLQLHCSNLEELKHFYTKRFRFREIHSSDESFTLHLGSSQLTFTEDRLIKPYYHFAMNVPPQSIEQALTWAQRKTEILTGEDGKIVDFPNWKAKSIYFLDPAGNIVEFIARDRFGEESSKSFNENSILNVSEIGLPVFAVPAAFKSLNKATEIVQFDGRNSVFCAVGNDEGLFIMVDQAEKAWFPTDVAAKEFPLSAEFEEAGETYNLETGYGLFAIEKKIKPLKKVG